jgi:hypothetical protein
MTLKRTKKGEEWHICANENCRNKVLVKAAGEGGEDADE